MEASQRVPVRGPTFIRLLARLADVDVAPPRPSLPDRLSQWIDWTRAVALSRTLDGKPLATNSCAPLFDSAQETACSSTRTSLVNTIAGGDGRPLQAEDDAIAHAEPDYTPFRQHYVAMQRAMQTATGELRGRLRDMLAGTSADMARLADVDAHMELVLSPREDTLLAAVPALLGQHFERLRAAAHQTQDSAGGTPRVKSDAWLDVFRKDMQHVLLAELDVRFLPLDGLLAALRLNPQGRHVQTPA